jgi:hypothetical protein
MLEFIRTLKTLLKTGIMDVVKSTRLAEICAHEGALVVALYTDNPNMVREFVTKLASLKWPDELNAHYDQEIRVLTLHLKPQQTEMIARWLNE